MAEENRRPAAATDPRLRALASAYRDIDRRYGELEALSRREHERLLAGAPIGEVKEILGKKRRLLEGIRTEEERVAEAKSWWSRVRRDLPAAETHELRDVLDGVARRIERALALEGECRTLLERAAAFRRPGAPSADAARLSASTAYGRSPSGGAR